MLSQPIHFQPSGEDVPRFLLPVAASVFAERAERFASLAQGHSLGDWLGFLGRLTAAQHAALQALPPLPGPPAAALDLARTHHMPPLNAASLPPPAPWRDVARQLATRLADHVPAAGHSTLAALASADDERLDALAAALLAGQPDPRDGALLPLVAAALQVVWTALASRLEPAALQPLDTPGVCPCCGSLPVASIVRLAPTVNNLRYLHCSLCNCQWNLPRATCPACASDQGVAQHQVEGANGAVRAETCEACRSYLKIVYQEKDPRVDPVADDLASLALDLLVDEAGYGRSGPNLLLVGGAPP
mgnify:CR=1 FL=1